MRAYVENGGLGLWCPHCEKSIEIDKGSTIVNALTYKTAWLSFWIFKLIFGTFLGFIFNITDVLEHRPAFATNIVIYVLIICIIIYAFVISVAIGLIKKRIWAWKANWAIIIGEPLILALEKTPKDASTEHQLAYLLGSFGFLALVWIWPNYIYFKKRRSLFS